MKKPRLINTSLEGVSCVEIQSLPCFAEMPTPTVDCFNRHDDLGTVSAHIPPEGFYSGASAREMFNERPAR